MHSSTKLNPLAPPPMQIPGVNGHTTVLVGNTLISYGGMTGPFQFTSECYALDLSTLEFSRLLCTGTVPPARAYHSAVMVGWRMFVYGGLLAAGVEDVHFNRHNAFAHADAARLVNHCAGSHGNTNNNDSYVRDVMKQRAQLAEDRSNSRSPARKQSTIAPDVFVTKEAGQLGGVLSSNLRRPADEVLPLPSLRYIPDCEARWPRTQQQIEAGSLHILNMSEKECNWVTIPAIGFAPIPRAHHSACVFQNHMYIAGGYSVYGNGVLGDPDTHACAALHALNTDTLVWRRVETSTMPWPARWGFASVLGPDGRWFFASGVNPDPGPRASHQQQQQQQQRIQSIAMQQQHQQAAAAAAAAVSVPCEVDDVFCLDLVRREWEEFRRPEPSKTIGPRRAYFQAAWNIAGRMYVHGGMAACGYEILGDLLYMDQETGEWIEVKQQGREIPSPRCGHSAVVVGTEVFIFGGLLSVNIVPVTMTSWNKFPDVYNQYHQQHEQYQSASTAASKKPQVTAGVRSNEVYALNMQTMMWRKVGAHVSEFVRRNIIMPPMVSEALVLDPLPPRPDYSLAEIKKPGSSEYVPPQRRLPWDISELDVERMQHNAMRARFPVGSAVETAVEQSILDARQVEIALGRSKVRQDSDDDPVIMWGEQSNKNAVAAARAALTEELQLRVKRLDDFTAAASEGRVVAETLRSYFAKDVAPTLRDATKWRETAALEPQRPRTDPFQDILFSFNKEVKPKPVTVDTAALPLVSDYDGSGVIATVMDSRARAVGPAMSGGLMTEQEQLEHAGLHDYTKLDRPWAELTPQQQMSFHAAQLHKPSLGVRTVSRSLKRLGLDSQLKIVRGDAPVAEDAHEQMARYLASRNQARADYSARKAGVKKL